MRSWASDDHRSAQTTSHQQFSPNSIYIVPSRHDTLRHDKRDVKCESWGDVSRVLRNMAGDEEAIVLQWWANHKSNHEYESQIICKNYLNQNLKSKIKSQIIKSNTNHFWSKLNQITNQFDRNVKFLKMFSLHNNYRISQKSQPFCIRQYLSVLDSF